MTTGHDTPLTPPPASPPASAGGPEPTPTAPARSAGTTAIMIVTAVVGGVALLGSGGAAAAAATGTLLSSTVDRGESVQRTDAAGIDGIDLDVDAGNMRIEFGDVDQARLAVTNGRGPDWTLDRDGDTLVVRSPDQRFGWWFGSWFGAEPSAVLTLPEDLRQDALDADLTLDAGALDVSGDFGALDITVDAGALDVEGAAQSLGIHMSAGRADVMLADVDTLDVSVSAGDFTLALAGSAPTQSTVEVSAGSVDLTVPDVEYAISRESEAGSLDATVQESSSASRSIDVRLAAGSVTIRPGR